jgi:hypothetical protein
MWGKEQLHPCSMRYVALPTLFLTSKINYWLFTNLTPIKLKLLGNEKKVGDYWSNSSGPIKPSSPSTAGVRLCCAFCQHQHIPVQKCKNAGPKPFCWAKPPCLSFLHPKLFIVQVHQWSCIALTTNIKEKLGRASTSCRMCKGETIQLCQGTSTHQHTIHWMPIITQSQMNLNWVKIHVQ